MNIVRGFVNFNRGLLRLRPAVQLWVLWLIALNGVISTYFMPRVEATVIFYSFMLGAVVMSADRQLRFHPHPGFGTSDLVAGACSS